MKYSIPFCNIWFGVTVLWHPFLFDISVRTELWCILWPGRCWNYWASKAEWTKWCTRSVFCTMDIPDWTQRWRFAPVWSLRGLTRMGLIQCLSNQPTTNLVQGQYDHLTMKPIHIRHSNGPRTGSKTRYIHYICLANPFPFVVALGRCTNCNSPNADKIHSPCRWWSCCHWLHRIGERWSLGERAKHWSILANKYSSTERLC